MGGRGTAAPADQIDQTGLGELGKVTGLVLRRLVVLAEGVGQARVRIAGDEGVGDTRHLSDIGPHLRGAQGTVETHRDGPGVPDGIPECLGDLAGQRPAGRIGNSARDDDRPAPPALLEQRLDGEHRRFGIQRVEDGLHEDDVGTTVDQAVGCFEVGGDQLVIGDVAGSGVVDVRRNRRGPGGGSQRSGDIAGLGRGAVLVGGNPRQRGTGVIQLVAQLFHAVVGQ
ncbi:Uncharacterised protein [Mycobacteroides abscessus subsp. abscessus]|nr:Uncharacterised protein [Mycobacteroides abscessus subsp. abscessus]